jgi:hypothetical protein
MDNTYIYIYIYTWVPQPYEPTKEFETDVLHHKGAAHGRDRTRDHKLGAFPTAPRDPCLPNLQRPAIGRHMRTCSYFCYLSVAVSLMLASRRTWERP